MCPHPVPSNSYNICLPSSAVNSLQNTELFHLTSFLSAFSALFSATRARQLCWNQFVPHSFYRNGGVGGSIGLSSQESLCLPAACGPLAAADPLRALRWPALSVAEGSSAADRRPPVTGLPSGL